METFGSIFRWSWLLGVALIAPVSLPAGGYSKDMTTRFILRNYSAPSFAGPSCILRASPFNIAPTLREVEIGTPLRVLRRWQSSEGEDWLQIQIVSSETFGLDRLISRGWVNI